MLATQQPTAECPAVTPPRSTGLRARARWPRRLLLAVLVLAWGGFCALRLVSAGVLLGLALLGVITLASHQLIRWQVRRRWKIVLAASLPALAVAALGVRTHLRYATAPVMKIPIREFGNVEYPEDPADRSIHDHKYQGRSLTLVQNDATHFDFLLEPLHPHVARIVLRDVDVALLTPSLPVWTREDAGLRRIALTDRQWNRQQVRFDAGSPHLEVSGGDGVEKANLYSVELAKNCLNAGLWEILLFFKEGPDKAAYYQCWFTFPLGHYKTVFENNTGLPYWKHWYYLEHWFDPVGTLVPLEKLRRVVRERELPASFDLSERVLAAGEQLRKRRTTLAENVRTWGDFFDGRNIQFAAFVPPGRYAVSRPWGNQYWRMNCFQKAILRDIDSPAVEKPLQELELIFASSIQPGVCRFIVSGFDLRELPQLAMEEYPKGLYMPMGIGVPPFFQSYEQLRQNPPARSPYLSVMLDDNDRWIDHHSLAVDGPVMHRDARDPNVLHVYLLSYERHSLVGHVVITVEPR